MLRKLLFNLRAFEHELLVHLARETPRRSEINEDGMTRGARLIKCSLAVRRPG